MTAAGGKCALPHISILTKNIIESVTINLFNQEGRDTEYLEVMVNGI